MARRPDIMQRLTALGLIAGSLAAPAEASFIDTDFYCRNFGCVIAHDGFTFDVYDAVSLETGIVVPAGGQLIRWSQNPVIGTGGVNPVFTGTRAEGFHIVPLQDESFRLGIDTTGNGQINLAPIGGSANGFLDASSTLDPFALTAVTNLVAAESSAQRSFYLSSSMTFYLAAQSYILGPADPLNAPQRLSNVNFRYQLTRSGNDDGMAFGANARPGNVFRPVGNVTHLGQLYGQPQYLMDFRFPISFRENPSLPSQSIRFDYVYGFEGYDLSMGAGHLRYRIEFSFFRR